MTDINTPNNIGMEFPLRKEKGKVLPLQHLVPHHVVLSSISIGYFFLYLYIHTCH
jgi:hypothetical protein